MGIKSKFRVILMSTLVVMFFGLNVNAESKQVYLDGVLNSINIEVNSKKVEADNILWEGTTYVPLRKIAEMLNREVVWDDKTYTANINDKVGPNENTSNNAVNTAVAKKENIEVEVSLNSINIEVNSKKVEADNILWKDTTYVPLRKIAEMLDKEVTWNQETYTSSINDKSQAHLIDFEEGKVYGNALNQNIVSYKDGYIYHSYNDKFYKTKEDGSLSELFLNYGVGASIVHEDYIYLAKFEKDSNIEGNIFKIDLSNKSEKKLNNHRSKNFVIYNEKFYYLSMDKNFDFGTIYSMELDASKQTKLSDSNIINFSIEKDKIYYTTENGLFVMNIDGADSILLAEDNPIRYVPVGEWVIYEKFPEGIYAIKNDKSQDIFLFKQDNIPFINAVGNKVYFIKSKENYQLYSINLDGTNLTKIKNAVGVESINLLNDYVYFIPRKQADFSIGRIKIDGSDFKILKN